MKAYFRNDQMDIGRTPTNMPVTYKLSIKHLYINRLRKHEKVQGRTQYDF